MATKGRGGEGEQVREVMEGMRSGIWWVLKEDPYFDSGVWFGVLGLGLSFGLMGLKVEFGSAMEGGCAK